MQIIDTLVEAGADALELGIPFSDPLADGPTIQNATLRAFAAGTTPAHCFEMLATIRQKYPDLPIGLLMYANWYLQTAWMRFMPAASRLASIRCWWPTCRSRSPVRSVRRRCAITSRRFSSVRPTPTTTCCAPSPPGRGYIYLLSRAGVTGAEKRASLPLKHTVDKLREYNAAPTLQGFGISEPAQVKEAIAAGADGAISGSAIVKIIEQHHAEPEIMLAELKRFVSGLKAATR